MKKKESIRKINTEVLLGARIPIPLKKELDSYCAENGLRMNFFITRTLKERLGKLKRPNDPTDTTLFRPTLAFLRENKDTIKQLAKKHGVKNVRVFGSVARGESKEGSDIDLLVDTLPETSLLDLAGFYGDLKDKFGVKFDIVTDKGLSPLIEKYVRQNLTPL